jgi:hypothetical protein
VDEVAAPEVADGYDQMAKPTSIRPVSGRNVILSNILMLGFGRNLTPCPLWVNLRRSKTAAAGQLLGL